MVASNSNDRVFVIYAEERICSAVCKERKPMPSSSKSQYSVSSTVRCMVIFALDKDITQCLEPDISCAHGSRNGFGVLLHSTFRPNTGFTLL